MEIISHCVWLYHRFPLSFREVEEMMLERGIVVSHETIRQWCAKFGQVIDVMVSQKRDLAATHRFFTRALDHGSSPIEVTTDRAAAYPRVLDELAPAACHVTEQYGNNSIEADHGRLKSRLRPMRGLQQLRCVQVIPAGHAFIQNIRRGHYELGADETANLRVPAALDELVMAI